MTFIVDEEIYEDYKNPYHRPGEPQMKGQPPLGEITDLDKGEGEPPFIVYNQTLTPAAGGSSAVYVQCESESEAQRITATLNSLFSQWVWVQWEPDDDPETEDMTMVELKSVQWVYA